MGFFALSSRLLSPTDIGHLKDERNVQARTCDYLLATTRRALGDEGFSMSWADGSSMGLEAAIDLALGQS